MTKTSRTALLWFRSDNRKSAIQNPKWAAVLAIVFTLAMAGAAALAQQPKKVLRIGYLLVGTPSSDSSRSEAIRLALRELGYIEGQSIVTEYRYTEGKLDRAPELAAELVRLKVDIILVTGGDQVIRAAKNATKTISIVMMGSAADPVAAGYVESLARPGSNVTGLTNHIGELGGKRWNCSKKPFPNLPVSRFSTNRPIGTMYSS